MDQIIIPADKKYRNRMLRLLACGILAGGAMAAFAIPVALDSMSVPGQKADFVFHVLNAGIMLMFLILFPFALYLLGIGKLTIATQRFPPPGVKVIKDTVLIQGEKALVRGRVMMFSSFVLIVLAIWGIVRVYKIAQVLGP